MVMVSLPKMSTTFTASLHLRRPGAHSCAALTSSNERSLRVRKLCYSFSKT